jgi:DNA-binding response OmpR family regulator
VSALHPAPDFCQAPRALVVEDDFWMQPLLSLALRTAVQGIEIDWVESAEEALRKTRHVPYRIILADIYLKPNRNTGIDFWYSCREECPEIPIVLMSGLPVDSFSKKMGLYGPHYLAKPFQLAECKEVIRNLVFCSGLSS